MNIDQEVDLNLKHYVGHHSEVLREVKNRLRNYLRNPNISRASRSIYSAIYNSLTYYQNISDLPIAGELADKTFLENMIYEFNKDYKYLSDKYNSDDPTVPKVIQAKGRIKSPISALDKILEKISEYIKDGMDLKLLNNSLRDFVGLRFIVDPPPEIKEKGKQAEIDFCYQVFNDLLEYRGLERQNSEQPAKDCDYHFVKVNTLHDPNKLEKMKQRPNIEGFLYDPEKLGIYIPTTRPDYIEKYDEYFKDYQMYPKKRLYQRLHICANPYFSNHIPEQQIPNFIIPSTADIPTIEYQVCTLEEEEFAEHGKASHTEYKGNRTFHRLGIPLFMKLDENTDEIRLTRLDEAVEEFYGYTFKSVFNIDYQTFLRTFDVNQRDDILAGKLIIEFDEETQDYVLKTPKSLVVVDSTQPISYIRDLLKNSTTEELTKFFERNDLLDNTIYPSEKEKTSTGNIPLQIVTLETPAEKSIETPKNSNNNKNQNKKEEYE